MTSVRDKKLLYHLTRIENLPSIWQYGLLSRREMERRGLAFADVADHEILSGRAEHGLDKLVPFHFMCLNPFDYGVVRSRPDETLVLLAVHRSTAAANQWSVIPRHPLAGGGAPEILPWTQGIEAIEWKHMDDRPRSYDDPEVKMTCMAEALSPQSVPASSFQSITVRSEKDKQQVMALLDGHQLPYVNCTPGMFPKNP